MIEYRKSLCGLSIIFRVRGSCLARAVPQTLLSVLIYFLMATYYSELKTNQETQSQQYLKADDGGLEKFDAWYDDPYAVGVLVTSCTFLITFRINFSYRRPNFVSACSPNNMLYLFLDVSDKSTGVRRELSTT